jgi:hypothetical protein
MVGGGLSLRIKNMGRMIQSEMWEDEFFTSMPIFDRLLWVGLITSCADDQGRLQDSAAMVRSKVFPVDDISIKQVSDGLDRFYISGKIARYIADQHKCIQIINWWKHQKPQWAGKSIYPPCEQWIDRLRYHAAKNEIITINWDKTGGFPIGYIADYIDGKVKNDVNGDVKGDDDCNDDNISPENAPAKPEPEYEPFNNQADMPQSFVDEDNPKPKKSRIPQSQIDIAEYIASSFGIKVPICQTKKDYGAMAVTWWAPIKEMLRQTDGDIFECQDLIDKTITLYRSNKLTMSSPKSLFNGFMGELAKKKNPHTSVQSSNDAILKQAMEGLHGS